MARVKMIGSKADVPKGGEAAWDAIAESRGRVVGPFQVLLHSPELAKRAAHTGAYVRFEGALPQDIRELAIMTVAREMNCLFEWGAHAPLARKAGVREPAITAIRDRNHAGLNDNEKDVVAYVSQLLAKKRVDEATFRALEQRFGVPALVELTGTVGHYVFIACTLNAFDVTPGPEMDQLPV
jgi:4-carboxymuconolactone decarboxylase